MAAEGGRAATSIVDELEDKPYRFEFFQAVRLLTRFSGGREPVGRLDCDPAREAVRFSSRVSFDFPPSQLYKLVRRKGAEANGRPPELTVAFMGLAGLLGALPSHYTSLLLEGREGEVKPLGQFLDLFNHRLISLFYRAWEKYHFPIAYERGGRNDRFTEYLFDLIGLGTENLRGAAKHPRSRLGLRDDEGLLLYAGLLAQRPHSASAVEAVLGDYFGAPVRLEQFAGQWLELGEGSVPRLGAGGRLGVNTVIGTRVWDAQSKFRLRCGPLTLAAFKEFLPGASAFRPLAELTRLLVGMEFDFDVRLVLRADEVPASQLPMSGEPVAAAGRDEGGPVLGRTSWLKTREFDADDDQVLLSVS
ncbi:MAG TPA: type VI secretion system baseplate subunit TssG [Pyrinomonadaceae bacterium]|jgi:type VI secretion system protein ImpH